jgi:hypothetical protein
LKCQEVEETMDDILDMGLGEIGRDMDEGGGDEERLVSGEFISQEIKVGGIERKGEVEHVIIDEEGGMFDLIIGEGD